MKYKSNFQSKKKGYTLLELLVVLGIIGFISLLVLPGSITNVYNQSIESQTSDLASQLYVYQQNAYAGLSDKSYGIKFDSSSYSIFIGPSYSSAEQIEVIPLNKVSIQNINLNSGGNEIVFNQGSLKPNATGDMNLSDGSVIYRLSINKEGFIEYYKV